MQPITSPALRTASAPAALSLPPPTSQSARSSTTRRSPTTKVSPDITCSYPSHNSSPVCLSSASMVSASTHTTKAGPCTQSNSAKRSASTRTPPPTTAASPPNCSAQYVWSSTPESTRKDGHEIKSWTSCVSPGLSTSPLSNPRPIATSRGRHKPSVTNSGSSRSANFANAPRKNWAQSLTSAASTTRCSTAELFPSISSRPAPTNGSHNKNQSNGNLPTRETCSVSLGRHERKSTEHAHGNGRAFGGGCIVANPYGFVQAARERSVLAWPHIT